MSATIDAELEQMGWAAAEHAAGSGAVERVEVRRGIDVWDRPAYHFSFLIDQSRARQDAGLVRIRIMQKLLDDLDKRGDDHRPVLRILNREDWDRRTDAVGG